MRDRRSQDKHFELELPGLGAAPRPDNSSVTGNASEVFPGCPFSYGNYAQS